MTFFRTLTFVLILSFSLSSFALDLKEARKSGKVKELPNGYIEAADKSADVKALVEKINSKRKSHYEKVAKKNGTSVDVVGAAAAEKIKAKLKN